MALDLTASEASQVAQLDGLAHIQADFNRYPQTDYGPAWIGADSIWDGSASATATEGEGVTVGVIDTGINLDHTTIVKFCNKGVTICKSLRINRKTQSSFLPDNRAATIYLNYMICIGVRDESIAI